MTDTILLDFDGVLFRNNRVHDYIKHKSIKYLRNNHKMRQKFPYGMDTYEMASKINEIGYKTMGHTSMLIDKSTKSVLDYNDYVFDDSTLLFTRNSLTADDYKLLDDVAHCLQRTNKRIGLFTNTPMRYCTTIIDPLLQDVDLRHALYSNAFTSDTGLVKPYTKFYKVVDKALHVSENPSEIYFIDDTFLNINQVFKNRKVLKNNWFPICIDSRNSLLDYLECLSKN